MKPSSRILPWIQNGHPKAMKRYLILFLANSFFLVGCRDISPNYSANNYGGNSILDLEYINDTLGIEVKDVRVSKISQDQYKIEVFMWANNPNIYGVKHHFYLHFYPEADIEKKGTFYQMTTTSVRTEGEFLIYSGNITTDINQFDLLRFGLVGSDKNRLFTISVDTIQISFN